MKIWSRLSSLFALSQLLCYVHSWRPSAFINIKVAQKIATAGLVFSACTTQPTSAIAGIDALDSATRAMMDTRKRTFEEKDVESLSPSAKKRKALAICKETSSRRATGYSTVAECTSAVLEGNYDSVLNPNNSPLPARMSLNDDNVKLGSQSSQPAAVVAATSAPAVSAKSTKQVQEQKATVVADAPVARKTKVQDLSDLSTAQKKRRAVAACKKSGTRQAAKAGSESKCVESVMRGDFDAVIEAIEYGY